MVTHTQARRKRIADLWLQGRTVQQIARRTGEYQAYVSRWVSKLQQGGSVKDAPRSGRPKKVVPEIVTKLRRAAHLKRGLSVRKLSIQLRGRGIEISPTSVWRGLRFAHLRAYRRPKRAGLQRGDKRARLSFASKYKDRNWKRVMFADEKTFYLCTLPNQKNDVVWADSAEEVEPHGSTVLRAKWNVYAAISREGHTALHIFDTNMTAALYVKTLQKTLLPTTAALYPGGRWAYVQDNDPKHRAKLAETFVSQSAPESIFLPPRSPDLNPIENVWSEVGDIVALSQPKTKTQLRAAINRAWKKVVTPEMREALIDSYPRRLLEVRRNRGAMTHY